MTSRKPSYDHHPDDIEINAGRATQTLRVANVGDRPVQVGSHFHFFEVNRALRFDRELAWGMHLDIAAGTGVRFEPGDTKEVVLVAYAGGRHLVGFNGLVNGGLDAPRTKVNALARLASEGFENAEPSAAKKTAPAKTAAAKTGRKASK